MQSDLGNDIDNDDDLNLEEEAVLDGDDDGTGQGDDEEENYTFCFDGDITDDEEPEAGDSAYTRVAKPMPVAGKRTLTEQYLHEASICGRTGPPLTARAGALSTAAADRDVVPLITVDHGVYMKPIPFITFIQDEKYADGALERMGGIYQDGIQYSQWKKGLQLASGIGLSCANISRSIGKYSKDHHESCLEEPCVNQISSTGVSIMQCTSHRQTPTSFNHISLAAYWFNFSNELVLTHGSFFLNRAKWRAAIKPRMILLDWLLLSYIYLEQEINVKQGRPLRFPITATGAQAPVLSAATPKPAGQYPAIEADYQQAQSAKQKRSGVKVIGGSEPKSQKHNSPGSGRGRGKGNSSSSGKGSGKGKGAGKGRNTPEPSENEKKANAMSPESVRKALAKFMDAASQK
jgi:hypothetical protein